MRQYLYRLFIELTNKKWSSRLLSQYTASPLSKPMIRPFMKAFQINEQEMAHPVEKYKTLHDFFIRVLASDARIVEGGPGRVISPVDARLAEAGEIKENCQMLIKGKVYSLSEMLGSREKAAGYEGGTFLVFYLSPGHYHRIHSPVDGMVMERWVLGKHSYPVNDYGLKYGKAPLSKNYRDITELQAENKKVAVVKVGAMFVNSVTRTHTKARWKQGEEVAYFNFGSTVVLLFECGAFRIDEQLTIPGEVKVGQKIGMLT
ncbi:phosphatidylserine decarboxylase [Bacillus thermotolerans]|uniref:phosphatidylserine decarboxylase n=1 Tax=Bacillus thermotolerans TaxID=1221996 RepID=UPI000580318A|nr:phosphatidylserine decarboxylase [Bacillus thermotolerans]KKB36390.1 Phosphatidylserine decarboxylase [Bacillus thermotolerans]